MNAPAPVRRYRFGVFDVDAATGELRRQGIRVRLHVQPFQLLCLLLDHPGELLTRDQIARDLWPDGTFVDAEHGVNSAINRLREALGDTAASPRFIETLARRGYRFIAPVEHIGHATAPAPQDPGTQPQPASAPPEVRPTAEVPAAQSPYAAALAASPSPSTSSQKHSPYAEYLATPEQLPKISASLAQTFFVLFQLMYVAFYVGALANLREITDLFSAMPHPTLLLVVLIVTAAVLIPVRAFILAAVLLRAPSARRHFLRLWFLLFPLDELWALAPFLLLHHINAGLAIACTALLAWSPFAQRSLILMGAGSAPPAGLATPAP